MSLLLNCPNCGERPLEEFYYGEIPVVPADIHDDNARDLDRAFMIDNRDDMKTEHWFHAYGCRRWLTLERHRSSNELVTVS